MIGAFVRKAKRLPGCRPDDFLTSIRQERKRPSGVYAPSSAFGLTC